MALPVVKEDPGEGESELSAQQKAAVEQLNVDPSNARFMLLVDDLVRPESLPRGWTAEFKEAESKWVYTDKAGVLHDKHPVYDYYIGAMFMDLGGYTQLKAIAAARPPTAEEVQQMGQYFGIKPDEDKYIWEVAEMGLCAPLPPGWQEQVVEEAPGQEPTIAFRHETSSAVQQEHPLDNYFRELIRRRRRELLRRKKAALKSLQALVKMGMGRRSSLAAATAQAGGSNDTQQQQQQQGADEDIDSLTPETQAAMQAAWHDLLGTAGQLVACMQAAAWDGSTGLTAAPAGALNTLPIPNSTDPIQKHPQSSSCSSAAAPAKPQSAAEATTQRLQQLSKVLAEARGPPGSSDAHSDAAAAAEALASIEQLAAMAAAAGSDADALAAALAEQGIALPQYAASVASSNTRRLSGVGSHSGGSSGSSSSSRRPTRLSQTGTPQGRGSLDLAEPGSQSPGDMPFTAGRRTSLLGDELRFVGVVSTSGAGCEPWSLAGGLPDAAGQAAGAAARSAAAAAAGSAGVKAGGGAVAQFGHAFDAAVDAAAGSGGKGASATPSTTAATGHGSPGSAAAAGDASTTGNAAAGAAAGGPVAVAALSLLQGSEFPPAAEAAMQHLAALHAVLQEALSLIQSWQQQRVIIALLQRRLQQAVHEVHSSQQRLLAARAELQHLQLQQQLEGAEAAAAMAQKCSDLMQQLQESQQQLETAQQDQQVLQQRLEAALADLASSKAALEALQAQSGSDSATAAAQAAAHAATQQQLDATIQQLQKDLQEAQAAAAAAQQHSQELEQAHRQGMQQQLQQQKQLQEELDVLQALHKQLLNSSGAEVAAASATAQELKAELQKLQESHSVLQQQHATAVASLAAAQEQQQHLEQQLTASQQQLAALQAEHVSLQAEHAQRGQQLQETQAALAALQDSCAQQGNTLSTTQQQLVALQGVHAAALRHQQELQEQQRALQAQLATSQADLAAMQAAAKAAEQKRAAMPHRATQVSAADHAAAHWVAGKGVQTGEELNPKATKDVGTPADLALLSYFFREIKQKQRGGGGAILGYDPAEAAAAAAGPGCQSAKSAPGTSSSLPPISPGAAAGSSKDGGKEGTGRRSPGLLKRPATMPGSIGGRRPQEEEEEEEGGFDTRPPPWEVRQRVDRRRDKDIKLEAARAASATGDRWDYAEDERDNEIAELKRRLVEAEKRAKDAAGKADDELRSLASELHACKRSLEQAQAENFSMHKELVSLRLLVQAVEAVPGTPGASGGSTSDPHSTTGGSAHMASPAASLPGSWSGGGRTSTLPGLTHPLSGGGTRSSMIAGSSSPATPMMSSLNGSLGSAGGRASSVVPYGASRLSTLQSSVAVVAAAPNSPASQPLNPYAAGPGSKTRMT